MVPRQPRPETTETGPGYMILSLMAALGVMQAVFIVYRHPWTGGSASS